jgi:hypothetical protein
LVASASFSINRLSLPSLRRLVRIRPCAFVIRVIIPPASRVQSL